MATGECRASIRCSAVVQLVCWCPEMAISCMLTHPALCGSSLCSTGTERREPVPPHNSSVPHTTSRLYRACCLAPRATAPQLLRPLLFHCLFCNQVFHPCPIPAICLRSVLRCLERPRPNVPALSDGLCICAAPQIASSRLPCPSPRQILCCATRLVPPSPACFCARNNVVLQ